MKQFVLFGGHTYYASGGWLDYQGNYVDLASAWVAAQTLMESDDFDWWQIVDVTQGQIVSQSESQDHA